MVKQLWRTSTSTCTHARSGWTWRWRRQTHGKHRASDTKTVTSEKNNNCTACKQARLTNSAFKRRGSAVFTGSGWHIRSSSRCRKVKALKMALWQNKKIKSWTIRPPWNEMEGTIDKVVWQEVLKPLWGGAIPLLTMEGHHIARKLVWAGMCSSLKGYQEVWLPKGAHLLCISWGQITLNHKFIDN